jgi:hypothetical protein
MPKKILPRIVALATRALSGAVPCVLNRSDSAIKSRARFSWTRALECCVPVICKKGDAFMKSLALAFVAIYLTTGISFAQIVAPGPVPQYLVIVAAATLQVGTSGVQMSTLSFSSKPICEAAAKAISGPGPQGVLVKATCVAQQ